MSGVHASTSQTGSSTTAPIGLGRVGQVEHFLACLQNDPGNSIADLIHDDFQQFDLPDPCSPGNSCRTALQLIADWKASVAFLQWQRIHVASVIEVGDRVVARVRWEGMTPPGAKGGPAGTLLSSELGIVFGFREGKIVSQRNYDWRRFLSTFSRLGDWSTG